MNHSSRAYFESLTTEELQAILRADVEADDSGDNGGGVMEIMEILDIIVQRDNRPSDAHKAWERFQKKYMEE